MGNSRPGAYCRLHLFEFRSTARQSAERGRGKYTLSAQKTQTKIDRHYTVAQNILRQYGVDRPPATPLVEYSRYVLRSGSETEKTAFANGITSKVAVKNGVLRIS